MRVTSNGESIEPHPRFAYICRFARGGMVEADGVPLRPAKLSELGAGEYYVGILVVEYGDYLEEWDVTEYTGWECVFRLTVE